MKTQTSQSEVEIDEWYKEEFSAATLGDKRLNKRLVKVAKDLSGHPSMPINQASGDGIQPKGLIDFLIMKM